MDPALEILMWMIIIGLYLAFHIYAPFYCFKKATELNLNRGIAVFAAIFIPGLAYLIYAHLSYHAKKEKVDTNNQLNKDITKTMKNTEEQKIESKKGKQNIFKWFVAILAFILIIILINAAKEMSKTEFESCYDVCASGGGHKSGCINMCN